MNTSIGFHRQHQRSLIFLLNRTFLSEERGGGGVVGGGGGIGYNSTFSDAVYIKYSYQKRRLKSAHIIQD